MTKINFSKPDITTTYVGRNGTGMCRGIEILDLTRKKNPKVMIAPINSKGKVANCNIDIPIDDIPALIAVLTKYVKVATESTKCYYSHADEYRQATGLVVGAEVDVTAKDGDMWSGVIYRAEITKIVGDTITIEYSNEDEGDVCWDVDTDQCKISE